MKKRIVFQLLALFLLLSFLAACQSSPVDKESGSTKPADTSSQTSTDSGLVNPVGQFPISKEKVTLSAYFVLWDGLAIEGNKVLENFEKKTNIHFDIIKETDPEMKTLLISSGDYPDIFFATFTNLEVANYGPKQKVFIPLDDLIKQYSVEVKTKLEKDSHYRISATSTDGKIYGLPRVREEVFSHPMARAKFWINTHWLNELGLKKPETTAEFHDVMLAFKNNDPNRNKLNDEVPISGAIKTGGSAEPEYFLLNSFTYVDYNHFLYPNKGKIEFVANTPEYREGLIYVRSLYQNNLLDPASFTQDLAQLTQLGTSDPEILGSFAALHPAMAIDISNYERSSHYDYLVNLKGPKGTQYAVYAGTDGYYDSISVAITDKCKYPEIAMRAIDYMYSEEMQMNSMGPEGKRWEWVDDPNLLDMYGNKARYRYLSTYVSDALRSEVITDEFPLSLSATLWGREVADVNGDIFDPANYGVRLAKATQAYVPYFPEEVIVPYKFDQATSEELATMKVSIVNYVQQATTRFITGDMSIENDWDDYLKALENLNVKRYVEIHQKGYDELKALEAKEK